MSDSFFERLIGTVRREYLDRLFFWNSADLTRKLAAFRDDYIEFCVHRYVPPRAPRQDALRARLPRHPSRPRHGVVERHRPSRAISPLGNLKDELGIDLATERSRHGRSQNVRPAVIMTLARLGEIATYGREANIIDHVIQLLDAPGSAVR